MTYEKVEAVNALLLAGEPQNISVDDHGTTTYTGYAPQALLDAMNTVFWGEWGFEELSNRVEGSEKGGLALAQVRVWLKDVAFQPTAWGQNRVTRGDLGDALKGAQTDAIKKALSYFSIGNRAYHGLLTVPEKRERANSERATTGQNNKTPWQASPAVAPSYARTDIPQPRQLREQCERLYPGQWEEVITRLLGKRIADDDLTQQQCATLCAKLTRVEKNRQTAPIVAAEQAAS